MMRHPGHSRVGTLGRVILWHNTGNTLAAWIQRKGRSRQKGGKDKSMECWGKTGTADLKAALLGRGRKKKERGF